MCSGLKVSNTEFLVKHFLHFLLSSTVPDKRCQLSFFFSELQNKMWKLRKHDPIWPFVNTVVWKCFNSLIWMGKSLTSRWHVPILNNEWSPERVCFLTLALFRAFFCKIFLANKFKSGSSSICKHRLECIHK